MPLPCKKGEGLQYNNFKCPECQTQFSSKTEMVTHFQQIRGAPNSVSMDHVSQHPPMCVCGGGRLLRRPFTLSFLQTCTQCSPPMMLPNPCAVSAHQRIHKHRAPHVCPECGGVARQASFQTHLEEACLHFARRIGYRCGDRFSPVLAPDPRFHVLCHGPDVPAARWCSEGSTPSSPTFRRLIVRCSTSAPAAPWRSSPPPAPRATSARSTQR